MLLFLECVFGKPCYKLEQTVGITRIALAYNGVICIQAVRASFHARLFFRNPSVCCSSSVIYAKRREWLDGSLQPYLIVRQKLSASSAECTLTKLNRTLNLPKAYSSTGYNFMHRLLDNRIFITLNTGHVLKRFRISASTRCRSEYRRYFRLLALVARVRERISISCFHLQIARRTDT